MKERIKQLQYSNNVFSKFLFLLCKAIYIIVSTLFNSKNRAVFLSGIIYFKNYAQRATYTLENRYPLIFSEVSKYLENLETPHILSYGCSTGEEVKSLGEYMPQAIVYGAEINNWCLKQCKKNNQSNLHFFYHINSKAFKNLNNLDAIFCMAVFQHTINRTDKLKTTTSKFTFQQFEQQLILLDSKLKVDGLLIIDHCDFDFTETIVAAKYKPLLFEGNSLKRVRPLFNQFNKKISLETELNRVFVKIMA
jgi:hypothetical protein